MQRLIFFEHSGVLLPPGSRSRQAAACSLSLPYGSNRAPSFDCSRTLRIIYSCYYLCPITYQSRCSIVVSIPACHAGDPGSIPGNGAFWFIL
ncbi:hypothetical protein MUK42_36479 [Musa troglodytarum]|uniref:Uncharacterized protein n=1 Tax=Musa troglodytarum TaxID=320322 RepID=A0A9E7JZL1_9LILI|nr:hypothetical protein MUK42_36479 [Musa troglodytarum]